MTKWRLNELESGGHRSVAKVGAQMRREAPAIFLVVSFHFLALKAQFLVLVSAFVMVSTVLSVSCLLFFYSWFPRAQPFVKVGWPKKASHCQIIKKSY